MKRFLTATTIALSLSAFAAIPDGYYSTLDAKQGDDLSAAILALSKGHTVITYNTKTWPAFELTDVREFAGDQIWWDMYSNSIIRVAEGHDGLNIEHSVANSWWGGKSGSKEAYSDLHLLNPSEQNANNTKSNYPPGRVDTPIFDNGLLLVGKPVDGDGGGAANVFEPADEYKGDFARAYFYTFSAYSDLTWKQDGKSEFVYTPTSSGCTLQDWAVSLLLDWARKDPVDSKEINRNEEIYSMQLNRNPFIDYPELIEFVWGNRKGEAFSLASATAAVPADRPAAPVFRNCRPTAVNTYSLRYWDATTVEIDNAGSCLMISTDGGPYEQYGSALDIAAASGTTQHSYAAYTLSGTGDDALRSSISRLTVTPLDPGTDDYAAASWKQVKSLDDFTASYDANTFYTLTSENRRYVLSTEGGNTQRKFMYAAAEPWLLEEDLLELPVESAIFRLIPSSGKYTIQLFDRNANPLGFWKTSAKNAMSVASEGTAGSVSFGQNGNFVFDFGDGIGTIQFNKSQPRFLNYSTSQGSVLLYKFDAFGTPSGIETSVFDPFEVPVYVSGRDIVAPEGSMVFSLEGMKVGSSNLRPGVYVVKTPLRSVKIFVK